MSSFLVTGGAGFIGSHLVAALLERGHHVRVLDDLSTGSAPAVSPGADLILGDVADRAVVRQAMLGMDGCFHLAAVASVERGHQDWLGCHRTNLTGSITVFDAAAKAGRVPVVYASSAAVYGDNPVLPLSEESQTGPLSAYGADKLGCEYHGRVAALIHNVPTAGLRFFNIYGPGQDPRSPYTGVIAIFADRARQGQPLRINGDGSALRDFVYVGDAVAHLLAAMGRLHGHRAAVAEIFTVCTGRPTSILELATLLRRLTGSDSPIQHGPARAGDIARSLGDPRRAIRLLGVQASTVLEQGLCHTLDYSGLRPPLMQPGGGHQNGPQPLGMVLPATEMFGQSAANRGGMEQSVG
ncbi:NAD-dependent epimerase/dehydratase family protein [Oleisolibacter albus]|uniref:NAD-dependent epimerase/dehydratase family protein n=1 Tax=Oleisolibacter albus TaxID=2171757 RepID=UPI0012D7AF36|nr:NAD-dependent epimerase/dehydratase family protein [Oleisolibacter albus]